MPADNKIIETSDGSRTLFSAVYRQSYHSKHGALNECEHVYLQASGMAERLRKGLATRIIEVGFGTGLNFLTTAAAAKKAGAQLDYWAVEKQLLPASLFLELDYIKFFPGLDSLFSSLAMVFKSAKNDSVGNVWKIQFAETITLHVMRCDALRLTLPQQQFNAVYHDAFSPAANPELWTAAFFMKIKSCCAAGAVLSTYSSKKTVQTALCEAGFTVEKQPGPWGKRDILTARV